MAYTDKKVTELRIMCSARRLATSGTKATLINRLERYQEEIFIKQETSEMQIDTPVTQQLQEVKASPHISETPQEILNNVKIECDVTNDTMETDDYPSKDSYLPQQSLEQQQQDTPPNVDMSNEYPQSIDPVEQQQIDQPPTVPSVATSPIVTHEVSAAEVPSSTNNSSEQNNHVKSKPIDDSLEKTSYSTSKYEIDRELLTRFKNLETLRMFSRGITMNQGQTNGVPYDYDLLLDIVQKSVIYNDGEIPDCLRYDYDSTYGATHFGEPGCVRNVGMELIVRQS